MDEFVEAKIEVTQRLDSEWRGPVAVLKTRRGDEYHVWIAPDGQPLIKALPTPWDYFKKPAVS